MVLTAYSASQPESLDLECLVSACHNNKTLTAKGYVNQVRGGRPEAAGRVVRIQYNITLSRVSK